MLRATPNNQARPASVGMSSRRRRVLGDEFRFRVYQLPGDLDGTFVFLQARPDQFDRTVELADRIIDGMHLGSTT